MSSVMEVETTSYLELLTIHDDGSAHHRHAVETVGTQRTRPPDLLTLKVMKVM